MERRAIISTILNKLALFLLVFSIFFVSFESLPLKTTTIWFSGILLIIINIIFFKEKLSLKDRHILYLSLIDILLLILSFFANNFNVSLKFIILFSSAIFIYAYYKDKNYLYQSFFNLIIFFSKLFGYVTILSIIFEKLYFKLIGLLYSTSRFEIIYSLYKQGCYSGLAGQTGTNSFLISIGIIAIISLLFINRGNNKKKIIYNIYSLLILLTALILCNKRAITFIIIFIMLFVCFISCIGKDKDTKKTNFGLFSLMIIFILYLLIGFPNTFRLISRSINYLEVNTSTTIKDKPDGGIVNNDSHIVENILNGRSALYKQAIKYFVHNPLTGIGIDNFTYYERIQSHNSILQLLAEVGLIGTIPLLILIVYFFFYTFKRLKDNLNSNLYIFAFCSQMLILIYSLTGNPFHDFNQRNYYFIILAILFGIINNKAKNKKIGILTFHKSANYGAVLQAYALNQKLNNSEVIDYYSHPVYDFYQPLNIKKYGKITLLNSLKTLYHVKDTTFKKWIFNYFRNNHLDSSEDLFNIEAIINKCNTYNIVVSGSDQVWNKNITKEDDYIYFLNFPTNAKKCSYAASIGTEKISKEESNNLKKNLNNYYKITVREESAKDILNKINIKANVIIDPTLLLTKNEWDKLTINNKIKEEYIFVYCLDLTNEFKEVVNKASKKYKLKVVHLGRKNTYNNELYTYPYASPELFLTLLKNAKYVITNSFHGTVFSIIYHKSFISIPHQTRSTRQDNLLTKLNLKERLTTNISVLSKDYKPYQLDEYRQDGLKYIEELNKND